MRQIMSLLLTGILLLAACAASGAETIEPTAEYEEPRYRFEDLTAKETFTAEDGTELASYDYKLFTLAADNLDALSPEDREAAERNVENFNDRAHEVLEDAVEYGWGLKALAGTEVRTEAYFDETSAQGYIGGEIVSVRTDTGGYIGGAHGYSYTTGYTFDLSTGQFIDPVQLADDPAAFQDAAAQVLIAAAEEHPDADLYWDDYRAILQEWNSGAVYFDGEGMWVVFSAYELGPYGLGAVELKLDWEVLTELMGPGGVERLGMSSEN